MRYRDFPLLRNNYAVAATFRGLPAAREEIDSRLQQSQEKRRTTQPIAKSAGCIFKNPEGCPAGQLVDELGLKDRLLMPGWSTDADKLLAASDAFVLTSLWEGLPRSLVEAMSLGLPTVCYDTDGVKDIVKDGENGFLFKPGEIEPMARQIDRALKHEGMHQAVGQAARSSIGPEFDIDQMVRQQESLYRQLLNPSK